MQDIIIHSKFRSGPPWHKKKANEIADGLGHHGYTLGKNLLVIESDKPVDDDAIHILFGPNYFGTTFKTASTDNIITINRCFYGDSVDNVSIGWGDFNGLAKFPPAIPGRLDQELHKLPDETWRKPMEPVAIILGEYVSACDDRVLINDFYKNSTRACEHDGIRALFRPHPQMKHPIEGAALAPSADISLASMVYTYASTYGVHARLIGAPVKAAFASLAYDDGQETEKEWLGRVVASQWHFTEIESGLFWEHLKCLKQ